MPRSNARAGDDENFGIKIFQEAQKKAEKRNARKRAVPKIIRKERISKFEQDILKHIRRMGPWAFRDAMRAMGHRAQGASFPAAQQAVADDVADFKKLYKLVDKLDTEEMWLRGD